MEPMDDCMILVSATWNDWHSAEARLGDLDDVHWQQPEGAPRVMVCAYVSCASIHGDLSHHCDRVSAPHRVPVCILRSRNIPAAYEEAARRADGLRVACASPPD